MHGKLIPPGWRKIARELDVDLLDAPAVINAMTRDLAGRMRVSDAVLDAWDALDALEAATTSYRADPPSPPPRPRRPRSRSPR